MAHKLFIDAIRELGFAWPYLPLIDQHQQLEAGLVDLSATLEALAKSQAFYEGQLAAAFNFKSQTGADYSDFTDRFDELARMARELKVAAAYVEQIVRAATV